MVSKRDRSRSKSPSCLSLRVELDNRALRVKNNSLTQAVAKLQQDNAELVKQLTGLQAESFEVNSKYNNLKNVISIIDSTTKTCLPKINEVIETFTGIIQLCSVAANISNFTAVTTSMNRDARTQAVKPQIVNGHILHNPTITLSRLSPISNTPPRPSQTSYDAARPSTSQGPSEPSEDRFSNRDLQRDSDTSSDDEDMGHNNEEQNSSFVCKATRVSHRKPSDGSVDGSTFQDDVDNSEEENEVPVEEEESDGAQSEQRLKTIQEMEEEEADDVSLGPMSPRTRRRSFLQGRLQEVRIFLNQLPNTYIEQFRGSGNISISLSPPERRSSFKHRSSSTVGDANESVADTGRLYVEEVNCSRQSQGENRGQAQLKVSLRAPDFFGDSLSEQFSGNISTIRGLQTPSTSTVVANETNSIHSESLQELDMLHIELHKTSTPVVPRRSEMPTASSRVYESPNRSKSDSLIFKSNITKRKGNKEKRKVAQVLLKRLSLEKRLSGSPIKGLEGLVNTPVIRKSSEMRRSLKSDDSEKSPKGKTNTNSDEENVERRTKGKGRKKKRDSPARKAGEISKKLKTKGSPPKTASGRPSRAAKPKTLKEPNLNKKMRRSK